MKRDKFDKLMSELIRERAGWACEWPTCGVYYPEGARSGLEHSHFWGRRRNSVRWEPDNGLALCTGHHRYAGSNPYEHKKVVAVLLGEERYAALKLKSNTTRRWKAWEKVALYEQMKAALKDMKERRAMGHAGRLEFYLEAA